MVRNDTPAPKKQIQSLIVSRLEQKNQVHKKQETFFPALVCDTLLKSKDGFPNGKF